MKKLISIALILSMALTLTGGAFATTGNPLGAKKFTDVSETAWYYPFIDRLTKEGTVVGVSADKFAPTAFISHCEFVTMVIRSTLGDIPKPANEYHWAQRYMEKAYELGITGKEESPFDIWTDPILRQDMAKIITRCTELILKESPVEDAETFIPKIADWDTVCGACKPYALQAYAKGILVGTDSKGTFNGTGKTTRGEATCVIVKMIDLKYRSDFYDGIGFSEALDINEDGTMKMAAAERFIMATLEQTRLYKENGKYYVSVTYPDVPNGYEMLFGITIERKDAPIIQYRTGAIKVANSLPKSGAFIQELVGLSSLNEINFVSLGISVEAPQSTIDDYRKCEGSLGVQAVFTSGAITDWDAYVTYTMGGSKKITYNQAKLFQW